MPEVQVQLPFGGTLPTQQELGWNAGTLTVRAETLTDTSLTGNEDDYNPDNPDGDRKEESGWCLG